MNYFRFGIGIALFCAGFYVSTFAQEVTLVDHVSHFTVDKLGQLYYTDLDGNVFKHQAQNDSVKYYNNTLLGTPDIISAESGINVYIYYRDFGRLQILDNYVSLKEDVNLFDLGYNTITMITASSDGGVWMFDIANSELLKLSKELKLTYRSGDLRNLVGVYMDPIFLNESRGTVLLGSTDRVLLFDRFASYIQSFAAEDFRSAVKVGNGYIVHSDSTLHYYDSQIIQEPKELKLNLSISELSDMDFADDQLYLLQSDTVMRIPADRLRIQ